MSKRHVVVVGAGFSGLSAAVHLHRLGHEVTVVEAGSEPGGRAGLVHHEGFRFDTGPTVVTMVDLFAAAFSAVDAELDDFCTLHALDPIYCARFPDGTSMAVRSDPVATATEIESFAGRAEAEAYERFVAWVGALYAAEFSTFIDRDVGSVVDLARSAPALSRLAALGGFGSWSQGVCKIFADERLQRLFSFQAMYAGLSPLDALALFAIIAHMDTVRGVFAVDGGTQALAAGLAAAATKAGIAFHYDTTVEAIETGGSRPRVRTVGGQTFDPEAVVVTVDLPLAYRDVLGVRPPRAQRRAVPSPSCLVWHLAARGALPVGTAHHNVHFGRAWGEAFDELLVARRPMSDPSRFVTVASLHDRHAAPAGAAALFVLEPVPNLDGDVDWSSETPRLTERMRRWADGAGYPIDGAEVVTVIDPPAWRARGAARGTPFSLAHRFSQSGPFRPAPQDRRLPGVVFAGAGTRPGLGLPLVLISGRLAAERAHQYVRGERGTP